MQLEGTLGALASWIALPQADRRHGYRPHHPRSVVACQSNKGLSWTASWATRHRESSRKSWNRDAAARAGTAGIIREVLAGGTIVYYRLLCLIWPKGTPCDGKVIDLSDR